MKKTVFVFIYFAFLTGLASYEKHEGVITAEDIACRKFFMSRDLDVSAIREYAHSHDMNQEGYPPLGLIIERSIEQPNQTMVPLLQACIDCGADVNKIILSKETPLFYATKRCAWVEGVDCLLKNGARDFPINGQTIRDKKDRLIRETTFEVDVRKIIDMISASEERHEAQEDVSGLEQHVELLVAQSRRSRPEKAQSQREAAGAATAAAQAIVAVATEALTKATKATQVAAQAVIDAAIQGAEIAAAEQAAGVAGAQRRLDFIRRQCELYSRLRKERHTPLR